MTEELSDFPAVFKTPDVMPWETDESVVLWPFGERAGTALEDFSSQALVRMRALVVEKNGRGDYFQPLVDAIDAELFERQGE